MDGRTRIRIGRAAQRQHEPEKLPRSECVRTRAIHAGARDLSSGGYLEPRGGRPPVYEFLLPRILRTSAAILASWSLTALRGILSSITWTRSDVCARDSASSNSPFVDATVFSPPPTSSQILPWFHCVMMLKRPSRILRMVP